MAQQPMYQQIAEDLRRQIDSGTLARGSQLPTEEKLGERYDASRNTIRDAIKRLIALGLVETRPGQGTFVTPKIDPFVTTLSPDPVTGRGGGEGGAYLSQVSQGHRTPYVTIPKVEVQTPSEEVAKRLRIGPASQVVSRHEARYLDDIPWSLQTSFYPMEFILQGATRLLIAEDISEGAVSYLGESLGIRQAGYRDWITARPPDDHEQRFFGISHDLTVFELFRTAFDQNKKPMRVTVTVYPTDRNQFIVNEGDVPDPQYDEEPGEAA
jgi:GntR family transcriptional regulator